MKLKKFLLSPWSFIPIIAIFLISNTLEKKGIVHPIFMQFNIVDLGYFLFGIICLAIIIKQKTATH